MPQYDMTTDPQTWPKPDDVDVIFQQERYDQSDDFFEAVRDWMVDDDPSIDFAADRFAMTDAYERGFRVWLDRQLP